MSRIEAAIAPAADGSRTVTLTGLTNDDIHRLVIQGREYGKDKGFTTTSDLVADALGDALDRQAVR